MKAALICICLLFIGLFAHGQLLHFPCPDPNSPMTSTCDEACVICDLDGYTSTNSLTDLGEIPEGFCGEQHNTQWLAFMTSTPFLSLEVTAFSCSVNFQGIQVGLYSSNDCTNFDLISNCDNQIDPFSSDTITANNLFTGVIYYLVIDGFNGDICEFTIDVLEGSATNPDVVGTPEIIGLSQHCWGVQPRYYGTQVPGATDRTWTLDGEIVGHNFFVDLEFQTPGLYELCLTPSNPCYGPGETVCKDIEIVALEPIFSEFRVCEEEFPFEYLNTTFNSPGSYSISYYDQDSCIQTEFISLIEIDYPPTIEEFEYCFNEPYIIGSEVITEEGIYFVDLQTVEGCDSVVVLIIDEVADYETMVQDTICSNETYQLGNQSLEISGTYSATLQASDGCDSLVTLELEVLPAVEEFIQTSICQGDTLTLDTFSFTLSGNYPLVYTAANGCDSTLFVDLTVLPSYEDTLEVQICEGEQFVFQTDTLEASGIYCYEFTTQDGCDSLIYVDIQQFPSYFFVIDTSICANQNFTFLDSTLEISGTYEFGYQTENNCDSIYQVNLEIWPLDTTPIFAEICEGDSFALAGQIFIETGNYELFLPSAPCDSLLQLSLNVIPPATQEIDTAICQGDSLSLNGESLFENGTYVQMLQADSGCDSILTIQLEILETPPLLSLNETICTGDSLLLADTTFHESGIYELLLTAQNGCDSLIMLELTVIENDTTFLNEEICDGTVFDFHAQALSEAGTYRFDTISVNGCDSTIILDLSVNPETFFGLDTILCPGNNFVLQDTSFDIAGDYTWTLTNQFGCDSTIEIKLEYFEENITLIDTSICQGESLIVGNDTLNTSGSFSITTTGNNGCDAITNIELEVLSQSDTTLLFNICEGETLNYQDSILQQSGSYAFLTTNAQGCDSLIEVQLNVLHSQMENEEVVLCFGESLEWQDTTIMTTGFYQQIYQSQFGCDSIYQLEVEVLENNETLLFDTICNGETYTLGDQSLSTSGSYIYESIDQYSCDSVVWLELIVLPELDTFLNQQICVGESIIIDGTAFSESGTYEIELVSSTTGCDSLVILDLEVRPTYEIEETYTICGSNSIEIEGQIIEEAGTYQFDYLTEAGCDSAIVVTVEVFPEYADSLYYNICEGATIMVGDSALSEAGTYIFENQTINGCDSISSVFLAVNNHYEVTIDSSICESETILIDDTEYGETGNYIIPLVSQFGCDSIINLALSTFDCELSLEVIPNQTSCSNAEDGSLNVSAGGGYLPITASWLHLVSGEMGSIFIEELDSLYQVGDLPAGNYQVNLVDANGQTAVTEVMISAPLPLQVNISTFELLCSDGTDGRIMAEAMGGTPPYSYNWSTGDTGNLLENLPKGEYEVRILDAQGCELIQSVFLEAPPALVLDYQLIQPDCFQEQGIIDGWSASGGIGPYTLVVNDFPGQPEDLIFLEAGVYELALTDQNNCVLIDSVTVLPFDPGQIELGGNQTIELGQTTVIPIQTTVELERIDLEVFPMEACPNCTVDFLQPIQTADYQVTIEDNNGCIYQDQIRIFVSGEGKIYIPNAFSPNDDGFNDYFTLFAGPQVVSIEEMRIFDRWGNEVFVQENLLPNQFERAWSGKVRGKEAPSGIYVYMMKIRLINGQTKLFKGDVVLLR